MPAAFPDQLVPADTARIHRRHPRLKLKLIQRIIVSNSEGETKFCSGAPGKDEKGLIPLGKKPLFSFAATGFSMQSFLRKIPPTASNAIGISFSHKKSISLRTRFFLRSAFWQFASGARNHSRGVPFVSFKSTFAPASRSLSAYKTPFVMQTINSAVSM